QLSPTCNIFRAIRGQQSSSRTALAFAGDFRQTFKGPGSLTFAGANRSCLIVRLIRALLLLRVWNIIADTSVIGRRGLQSPVKISPSRARNSAAGCETFSRTKRGRPYE